MRGTHCRGCGVMAQASKATPARIYGNKTSAKTFSYYDARNHNLLHRCSHGDALPVRRRLHRPCHHGRGGVWPHAANGETERSCAKTHGWSRQAAKFRLTVRRFLIAPSAPASSFI